MAIDLSAHALPLLSKTFSQKEGDLLSFCNWVFKKLGPKTSSRDKTSFSLRVETSIKLSRAGGISVMFGGEYLNGFGMKFGEKSHLGWVTVDKQKSNLQLSIKTKPTYCLDPQRFGPDFFKSVIPHAQQLVNIFKPQKSS